MENRKEKRVKASGLVNGKIILVEHLEILDISYSGIRFNCQRRRRLEMNSIQTIKINKGDISVTLRGTAVRSTFMATKDVKDTGVPVYDVAMKFAGLTDNQKVSLGKLIRLLENE